jgi:hypothetical protein
VLSGACPHRRRSTGGSVGSHTPVLENYNGNQKEEQHEEGDQEGDQEVFGAQGRAEVRWRTEEDRRAQEDHREEGYAEADDQEGDSEAGVIRRRLHRCKASKKAGEIFAGLFACPLTARDLQAARGSTPALSTCNAGSPQTNAENAGTGSSRLPREMMMPIGSSLILLSSRASRLSVVAMATSS